MKIGGFVLSTLLFCAAAYPLAATAQTSSLRPAITLVQDSPPPDPGDPPPVPTPPDDLDSNPLAAEDYAQALDDYDDAQDQYEQAVDAFVNYYEGAQPNG